MAHEHNAPAPTETETPDAEVAPAQAPVQAEGGERSKHKARGQDRDQGRGGGGKPRDRDRGKDRDRDRDRDRGKDRGRGGDRRSSSPLTAGLFAHVADKHVPCRVAGCTNTWTWSGVDQMRSLGQPPPQRMCDAHLAELNQLEDKEIECRNPGCHNTWTWKRGAQLFQLQKHEQLKPPSRLCDACFEAEKSVADTEVGCRIPGCRRTWTWTKDAQQKHRAWLRRLQAKQEAEDAATRESGPERGPVELGEAALEDAAVTEGGTELDAPAAAKAQVEAVAEPADGERPGKKRRRKKNRNKKKRKLPEGPPEKMCGPCAAKIATLEPQELPCKVHGCTRTWTWSKEHQLRAWVELGTDDLDAKPVAPKRMCTTCRDFCRAHPDKAVACGRPGCGNTWMWKTGAQLQAHLAGKTQDPIRLCDTCAKGEFLLARGAAVGLPPGAEVMPCVVPGCAGTWTYLPGMHLTGASEGDLPTDRMCDRCRDERDLPARSIPAPEPEPTPAVETVDAEAGGNSVEENSIEENSDAVASPLELASDGSSSEGSTAMPNAEHEPAAASEDAPAAEGEAGSEPSV